MRRHIIFNIKTKVFQKMESFKNVLFYLKSGFSIGFLSGEKLVSIYKGNRTLFVCLVVYRSAFLCVCVIKFPWNEMRLPEQVSLACKKILGLHKDTVLRFREVHNYIMYSHYMLRTR
jgi:hypothetical protein